VSMRLVTFELNGQRCVGALAPGDKVAQITEVACMRSLLEKGPSMRALVNQHLAAVNTHIPLSSVRILAPIYNPEKIICTGMNYVDHCTEQNIPVPTEPLLFGKFASSIIASGDPLPCPPETNELDWEVELCIVIGKAGRRIKKENAMEYVAGYTVAHDVSARDWQLKRNGGQWLLGKTFDGFSPIGPAIVTPDELPGGNAHNLGIRCIVNGTVVQNSTTAQLVFKTEDVVEFASRFMTLKPGDLILTGTPPGVGVFRKPTPVFLKHGDVVTCEIDGIGSITNTVVPDPTVSKL